MKLRDLFPVLLALLPYPPVKLAWTSRLVRDRARGISAMLQGLEQPTTAASRELFSFVARLFDGVVVFPHPLAIRSRTWVAEPALEAVTENAIRRVTAIFAEEVRAYGAVEKEVLTGMLLALLSTELRREQLQAMALAGTPPLQRGRITLEHKPVPKRTDEPIWQCDLAVLVRANVPAQLRMESVTLIQVKKSLRLAAKRAAAADAWTVDLAQLEGIGPSMKTFDDDLKPAFGCR